MRFSFLFVGLILLASPVFGCAICVSKPLKIAFQDSEIFFVGTPTRTQPWSVTFAVHEQFKGERVTEVTLRTSNSCSISRFTVGVSYLVEATPTGDGGLHAYLCSHTRLLDRENRELEVVRRRAGWWKSRWSRISFYRFRDLIWRRLG